mmetsp:Transcript_21653/g.41322  ORF Transcript_21653/g.41322 Transcript_21653/m.41322 type:complete len:229 (-) Transcript_21653:371-1057(-)
MSREDGPQAPNPVSCLPSWPRFISFGPMEREPKDLSSEFVPSFPLKSFPVCRGRAEGTAPLGERVSVAARPCTDIPLLATAASRLGLDLATGVCESESCTSKGGTPLLAVARPVSFRARTLFPFLMAASPTASAQATTSAPCEPSFCDENRLHKMSATSYSSSSRALESATDVFGTFDGREFSREDPEPWPEPLRARMWLTASLSLRFTEVRALRGTVGSVLTAPPSS